MITFDTGALIAIERRRDRMLRVLRAAEQTSTPIVVPAVVLAEWWRGDASKRMTMMLEGVTIEPVDAELARVAGAAIAAVPVRRRLTRSSWRRPHCVAASSTLPT
jgi:predicted nucleic acid-binding protein